MIRLARQFPFCVRVSCYTVVCMRGIQCACSIFSVCPSFFLTLCIYMRMCMTTCGYVYRSSSIVTWLGGALEKHGSSFMYVSQHSYQIAYTMCAWLSSCACSCVCTESIHLPVCVITSAFIYVHSPGSPVVCANAVVQCPPASISSCLTRALLA